MEIYIYNILIMIKFKIHLLLILPVIKAEFSLLDEFTDCFIIGLLTCILLLWILLVLLLWYININIYLLLLYNIHREYIFTKNILWNTEKIIFLFIKIEILNVTLVVFIILILVKTLILILNFIFI